jgi:DNA-binding NarL/FixJ family response regulator
MRWEGSARASPYLTTSEPVRGAVQKNKRDETGSHRSNGISNDRLSDLLSAFSDLRRDSQLLLSQLRESLREMRELRGQLQEQRGRGRGNGAGNGKIAYLQDKYGLTQRELEVARLLAQGRTNTAIANTLHISTHTARHHTQRVLGKLGVHSRAAAGAKLR